jgi:4-hydroxybenzoate polyprenyltransferase
LWAVIANALAFFGLAVGLTVWLGFLVNSWWPAFGFGIAFIFGAFYSPVWKYWYMPEACGLLAFGVGGTALGMSVSGNVPVKEAFLLGIGVSLPFAVSWGVDQAYDAASDVQRGVRNIGGLLHVTGFPTWAYTGIGVLFTYAYVVFLVAIGSLGPWAGLTFLAMPAWILCLAWLYAHDRVSLPSSTRFFSVLDRPLNPEQIEARLSEENLAVEQRLAEYHSRLKRTLDLGVRFGLLAILVHMVALVVAEALR